MAKEENAPGKPSGDVDNIRKILFGDQVAQFEERFHQNENAIAQLRTENRNLRQALEAEVTMRENMDQDLHNLLDAFRQDENDTWKKNVAAQNEFITALETALRKLKADISVLPKQD